MELTFPTPNFTSKLLEYKHQLDFLRLFEQKIHRYYLLKWARRHGKSTMAFNILVKECLKYSKRRYAFIFSTYKSAKNIITQDPDMMGMLPSQDFDGQIWKLNRSDLTITFSNGSILQFFGADKVDSLRGFNAYGCVIDEYAMHKSDEIWTAVVSPVLTRNEGWCIFIYTPKGVNFASELYNMVQIKEMGQDWYCSTVTAVESGLISHKELEKAKKIMGITLFRQEHLCEDLADDDLVIIKQESILNLEKVNRTQKYNKRVIAVDPATTGDECMCYYMINSEVKDELSVNHRDTHVITGWIQQFSNKVGCKNIVIDSIGVGKGISDNLRAAGLNVIEFIASQKATDNLRFMNKKAEAWFKVKEQIEMGRIPPLTDQELKKQLSAVKYEYSGTNQRIKCESKATTKQKLGRSPDRADAFIMGVWAYDKLPDENRYKWISEIDKQRLRRQNGSSDYSVLGA